MFLSAARIFAWRVLYALAPLTLRFVDPRTGYVLMVLGVALLQLTAGVLGFLAERATMVTLYEGVGARLARVDPMRPLPLPSLDPEIAVARGIRARARLVSHVRPGLWGEGLALGVGLIWLGASNLRSIALPLGTGALLAFISYGTIHRAAARAQTASHEAWIRLYSHISAFMSERQERVAYGGGVAFLQVLAAHVLVDRQLAVRALFVGALLRRVPVALAIGAASVVAIVVGVTAPTTAASLWLLACLFSTGVAFASAFSEEVVLRADSRELDGLLALPLAPEVGRIFSGPCTRLTAREITYSYDGQTEALRPTSLEAGRSRLTVLRGPNGGGKSTILRLLAGLGHPTTGTLSVDGVPMTELVADSYRGRVAFVPQSTFLDPRVSVREAMQVHGVLEEATMLDALRSVGFTDPDTTLGSPTGPLSAGRKRRVQLARALAMHREVLLLDEPEAGLDDASLKLLVGHLRALTASTVVVVATHDPSFVGDVVLVEAST
jgi:ABC-type Mn2+/Zn2+ transport system ATPase subunit